MDLLTEIPDTTITITHQAMDTIISVPKRGQFKALAKTLDIVVESESEMLNTPDFSKTFLFKWTLYKYLLKQIVLKCCQWSSSLH